MSNLFRISALIWAFLFPQVHPTIAGTWMLKQVFIDGKLNFDAFDIAASKNIEKEKLRKRNENMQKYFGDISEPEKITEQNIDAKIRAFSNMSFLFDKNGSYILTIGSDSHSGSYTYQPDSHRLFLSNKGEQNTDSSSVELSDTTLIIESLGSRIKTKFVLYRKK